MATVLVFDIETIPDVAGLRRLEDFPESMSDAEVASKAMADRAAKTGSEFLPLFLQKIVAISCVIRRTTKEGAPQINSISFESPFLNNKAGIGFQFYDDKIGVEHATGLNTNLSTKIRVADDAYLSGGINIGLMNYRIDLMSLSDKAFQQNDIVYNNNFNKLMPILGAGIFYNSKNL